MRNIIQVTRHQLQLFPRTNVYHSRNLQRIPEIHARNKLFVENKRRDIVRQQEVQKACSLTINTYHGFILFLQVSKFLHFGRVEVLPSGLLSTRVSLIFCQYCVAIKKVMFQVNCK